MLDIDQLDFNKLSSQSVLADITEEIKKYVEIDNISDAKDLLDKLNELFKKNNSVELNKDYDGIISKLKFISLPALPEKEVANLLGENLIVGLKLDLDIYGKLDDLFKIYRDELTGFETHKLFARSIGNSQELIGNQKIIIKDKDTPIPPTIANWIRDFSSTLSNNRPASYIEEAEYLNKSNNVKLLSQDQLQLLKNTLRLYNYLRFPVRSRDKVKETGHTTKDKEFKPLRGIETSASTENPLASLKQKYNTYRRARWDVLRTEDEVLVQTQGDIAALKKELSSAAREYNKTKLIACVKILARQGHLLASIAESPAWQKSLADYIITKFSGQTEPDQVTQVISQLKYDFRNPAVISEFLQYLFVEKLKISQNEAALIAIEVCQLLGRDYELIAFGNQETGDFEFSKNKIIDDKLVMEK